MSGKILVYEHPGTTYLCPGDLAGLRPPAQLLGVHTQEGRGVDETEGAHWSLGTARAIAVPPRGRFLNGRPQGCVACVPKASSVTDAFDARAGY
jgi:hypothetical protein